MGRIKTKPDIITERAKYVRGWVGGGSETPCGFGSKISETAIQREWLPRMVSQYQIKRIVDVGAGDLNWINKIDWPHEVDYQALDLVPRSSHVREFDLIHEVPPQADMLLCIWVLNHLPEDHARAALDNLMASGSKYLVLTYESRQWDFTGLAGIESVVIRARNDWRGNVELRLIEC